MLSTTAGGLAMLLGFVLLGETAGTYRISELVAAPPAGSVVTFAVLCVPFGTFAYRALAAIALLFAHGLAKAGLFFVDRARGLLVGTVLTTAVRQPAMPLGVSRQPGRLLVALDLTAVDVARSPGWGSRGSPTRCPGCRRRRSCRRPV